MYIYDYFWQKIAVTKETNTYESYHWENISWKFWIYLEGNDSTRSKIELWFGINFRIYRSAH